MLKLKTKEVEYFDENQNRFIKIESQDLRLEHSLASISKWESKFCIPFLSTDKTIQQIKEYISYMVVDGEVDPKIISTLTSEEVDAVRAYIESPNTATTITDRGPKKISREIITSEVIYSWMVLLNIPFECETWNLDRLITLIRVCELKSSPPKKMSASEMAAQNRALNAQRKKALNTKG